MIEKINPNVEYLIYDKNDKLIRHFTSVKRKSDGEIGFYEYITKKFYNHSKESIKTIEQLYEILGIPMKNMQYTYNIRMKNM